MVTIRKSLFLIFLIFSLNQSTLAAAVSVVSASLAETTMLNPEGYSEFPRWSPDGTKIAFQTNRDRNFEIYVMDADGGNTRRLTKNYYSDQFPTWSPDGAKIAFSSMATGGSPWVPWLSAIFMMDADGQNRKRITNMGAGNHRPTRHYHDMYPAWSPSGEKIAFLSDQAQGWREIYTINPDGSELTQITFHRSHHWNLVWTPDSKRLIFDFRKDGFPFANNNPLGGIYSIDVGGEWYSWGDDLQVVANKIESEGKYDCVISPGAKFIGFHIAQRDPSKRTGMAGMTFAELEYVDGKLRIKEETMHVRSKQNEYSPSWLSDGKKIAFTSTRDGHSEIYTMNADRSNVKRLTYSRQ
jgi:Tol biopolymer transport system component